MLSFSNVKKKVQAYSVQLRHQGSIRNPVTQIYVFWYLYFGQPQVSSR